MDKQHDLLARRKLMDREKELQNQLRDSNEAEKDEILAQYHVDVKKIENLMNQEKDKSRNKLKDQLAARRNKRKGAALKKIEEKNTEENDNKIHSNYKEVNNNYNNHNKYYKWK